MWVPSLTLPGLALRRLGHQWPLALAQLLGVTAEQQRVALARALVKKPALLLADEPTAQLDSETGKSVLDVMRDATRSGTAILLATHDLAVVDVADRVLSMEDGRLVEREPAPASP
jgi:putative ABC transport system ATP-binding protein